MRMQWKYVIIIWHCPCGIVKFATYFREEDCANNDVVLVRDVVEDESFVLKDSLIFIKLWKVDVTQSYNSCGLKIA